MKKLSLCLVIALALLALLASALAEPGAAADPAGKNEGLPIQRTATGGERVPEAAGPVSKTDWPLLRGDTLDNNQLADGEGAVLGSGIPRGEVTEIDVAGSLSGAPEGAWDVSAAGDGSAKAWINGGKLTIAGTGGVRLPEDAMGMFANYANTTRIRFNGCVDTSGTTNMAALFYGCASLEALDIAGMDTSAATNMRFMFCKCAKLTTLDVTGFDTSNVANMESMFDGCAKLAALDVSGFRTGSAAEMDFMFSGCEKLEALDVSGFDTSNVTDMNTMFQRCAKLTALDVSGFDTSNVTAMEYMFNGCTKLTALDISGFDTSNVTTMNHMFFNCESLEALDVSGFDTSHVRTMQSMFDGCAKLAALDVSGFDTSNATDMSFMFNRCEKLTALDVSGFDTSNVEDMNTMFQLCDGLKALDVSGFDTSRAMAMDYMFNKCSGLEALDASGFDTSNVTDMRHMFSGCGSMKTLDISGFDTSQVTDFTAMFANCTMLDDIRMGAGFVIPDGAATDDMFRDTYAAVTAGGATMTIRQWQDETVAVPEKPAEPDRDGAPRMRCDALTPAEIQSGQGTVMGSGIARADIQSVAFAAGLSGAPGDAWDVSEAGDRSVLAWVEGGQLTIAGRGGVRAPANASGLFANYSDMRRMDFGGCFFSDDTTDMSDMFRGDARLYELDLSGFETFAVTDMRAMFAGCSDLEALDLSSIDTAAVTDMSDMFSGCKHLRSLDVSGFRTGCATNMRAMFRDCYRLEHIDTAGFDTSRVTDMSDMFNGCEGLRTINVSRFDTSAATDMRLMFGDCRSLAELNLSRFDTTGVNDFSGMLSDCTRLDEVRVGSAFVMLGEPCPDASGMFDGGPIRVCCGIAALDADEWLNGVRLGARLEKGDRGDAVKWLQVSLWKLGCLNGTVDGIFGGKTEASVRGFQSAGGLAPTGVADQDTLAAIAKQAG